MARAASVYAGSAVSPFPTPLPCTGFKQGCLTDESPPKPVGLAAGWTRGATHGPQKYAAAAAIKECCTWACAAIQRSRSASLSYPIRPAFAQICPIWARSGRLREGIARPRAHSCPTLPSVAQIGHVWPTPGRHRSRSCPHLPKFAQSGRVWARCGVFTQAQRAARRKISTIDMEPGEIGS